ncbi:hypothetical protein PG996_012622, partial [Apiospora saccharicola]
MKKPGANPSGTTERHGPFADFVGADATGIWAAATSGQASIATHLLACMLARTFNDPAKAVSVWAELVHERKEKVMACNTRPPVSLAEISAWNASIQAWLQTADSAMKKEHVQLNLVIKNISIPVMADTSLYASVTKAWTQALVGIERLIAGEPQSVTSGAIRLAISAWHLYPDLLVFTSQTTSVIFSGQYMNPSGVLTVGTTNDACSSTGKEGIYWSVALSHYRYYGRPTRATSEFNDRLTMHELYVVTLGGLLKLWGESRNNYKQASKWVVALWNYAAARFLGAEGQEREELSDLMNFGFRRGAYFLVPQTGTSVNLPWFGLRSPHIIKSLAPRSSKAYAIECLRQTAAACELNPDRTLITTMTMHQSSTGRNSAIGVQQHDYYTALPIRRPKFQSPSEKDPFLRDGVDPNWRNLSDVSVPGGEERLMTHPGPLKHRSWRGTFTVNDAGYHVEAYEDLLRSDNHQADKGKGTLVGPLILREPTPYDGRNFLANDGKRFLKCKAELELPPLEIFSKSSMEFSAALVEESRRFPLWISKADLDSHKVAETIENLNQGKAMPFLDLQASTDLLENRVNHQLLWHYLEGVDSRNSDENMRVVLDIMSRERSYCQNTISSLRNLAGAYEVVHNTRWGEHKLTTSLRRSHAFSCIAMMETGTLNLEPGSFDRILALAHGNSIYMMRYFITDPALQLPSSEIVRIVGNVGRAGTSLLVSPASQPLIRQLSNSLRAVTYANFDGKRENSFTSTSLHLSFTPHEFPLDYGVSGIIDHQVFYVGSVVSVHVVIVE